MLDPILDAILFLYMNAFTAFQQPFAPMPSQPCVGNVVTFPCEVSVTNNGTDLGLASAIIARDGVIIFSNNIPNHMLVEDGLTAIGIMINGVTLDDNGIVYTCTGSGAPADLFTSLILNVTGMYVYKCINAYKHTYLHIYLHAQIHIHIQ